MTCMKKMLLVTTMLVGISGPAFATVNPDINWLETATTKTEKPATKQGDAPFEQDTTFNLKNTRLSIVIPEGFTWKSGEAAYCCDADSPTIFFDFWIEKHEETDENVRTQRGFGKVEKDSKRQAAVLKSWEKRVHEDMAAFDKEVNSTSAGLIFSIVEVGEGIKALGAEWTIMNQQGIQFRVTQFEIWEGGQRDLIRFVAMVEGSDQDNDPNHQKVVSMAQSLNMSRTEANPVW